LCDLSDKDDGIFCIPFEDYMNFYDNTAICKYHDDYDYESLTINTSLSPFAESNLPFQIVDIFIT